MATAGSCFPLLRALKAICAPPAQHHTSVYEYLGNRMDRLATKKNQDIPSEVCGDQRELKLNSELPGSHK